MGVGILYQLKLTSWNEPMLMGEVVDQAEEVMEALFGHHISANAGANTGTPSAAQLGSVGLSQELVEIVKDSPYMKQFQTELIYLGSGRDEPGNLVDDEDFMDTAAACHLITSLQTKLKKKKRPMKRKSMHNGLSSFSSLDELPVDSNVSEQSLAREQLMNIDTSTLERYVSPFVRRCASNLHQKPLQEITFPSCQIHVLLKDLLLAFHDEFTLVNSHIPLLSQIVKEVDRIVAAYCGTLSFVGVDKSNLLISASFGLKPSHHFYNAVARAISASKIIHVEYQQLVSKHWSADTWNLLNSSQCTIGISCADSELETLSCAQRELFYYNGRACYVAHALATDNSSGVFFDAPCHPHICKYANLLASKLSNQSPTFQTYSLISQQHETPVHCFASVEDKIRVERLLSHFHKRSFQSRAMYLYGEPGSPKSHLLLWSVKKSIRYSVASVWIEGDSLFRNSLLLPFKNLIQEIIFSSHTNISPSFDFIQNRVTQLSKKWSQHCHLLQLFLPSEFFHGAPDAMDDSTSRHFLLDMLSDLIVSYFSRLPHNGILFCICNIHWIDTLSLDLLGQCMQKMQQNSCFLLSGTHPTFPLSRFQCFDTPVSIHEVSPNLPPSELKEFCSSFLDGARLHKNMEQFFSDCTTVPLLQLETFVQLLQEKCEITAFSDSTKRITASFVGEAPQLQQLYPLIRERIELLSELQSDILQVASVFGTRITERRLVALLKSTHDLQEIREAVFTLMHKKRLLIHAMDSFDDDHQWICMRHPVIRDVVYDLMPSSRRLQLHKDIFLSMLKEGKVDKRPSSLLNELVHHVSSVVCEEESISITDDTTLCAAQLNCDLTEWLSILGAADDSFISYQRAQAIFEKALNTSSERPVEDMRQLEVRIYFEGARIQYWRTGFSQECLQLAQQCQDACNLKSEKEFFTFIVLSSLISLIHFFAENDKEKAVLTLDVASRLLDESSFKGQQELKILVACRRSLMDMLRWDEESSVPMHAQTTLKNLLDEALINGKSSIQCSPLNEPDLIIEGIGVRAVYEWILGHFSNVRALLNYLNELISERDVRFMHYASVACAIVTRFTMTFLQGSDELTSPDWTSDHMMALLSEFLEQDGCNIVWHHALSFIRLVQLDSLSQKELDQLMHHHSVITSTISISNTSWIGPVITCILVAKLLSHECHSEAQMVLSSSMESKEGSFLTPLMLLEAACIEQMHLANSAASSVDSFRARLNVISVTLAFSDAYRCAEQLKSPGQQLLCLHEWESFETLLETSKDIFNIPTDAQNEVMDQIEKDLSALKVKSEKLSTEINTSQERAQIVLRNLKNTHSRSIPFKSVMKALHSELNHSHSLQEDLNKKKHEQFQIVQNAMLYANERVSNLTKSDVAELRSMHNPSEGILLLCKCLCILLNVEPIVSEVKYKRSSKRKHSMKLHSKEQDYWAPFRAKMDAKILKTLSSMQLSEISSKKLKQLVQVAGHPKFNDQDVKGSCAALLSLSNWVQALVSMYKIQQSIRESNDQVASAKGRIQIIKGKLELSQKEYSHFLKDMKRLRQELSSVMEQKDILQKEQKENLQQCGEMQRLVNVCDRIRGKSMNEVLRMHNGQESACEFVRQLMGSLKGQLNRKEAPRSSFLHSLRRSAPCEEGIRAMVARAANK